MHRRPLAAVLSLAVLAGALALPAVARAPIPLDYRAYDSWNAIRDARLSDDGRYLAYALTPEVGDPTLVVRTLATGAEVRESRGTAPMFTANSAFVVYTVAAPARDVAAAKAAKTPEDAQPKNGIGILNLATGAALTFDRVKSVRVPRDGGTVIAWLDEPAPHPAHAAAPSAAPEPSASPTAAPKADKKKAIGSTLNLRDLANGVQTSIDHVTEYALSDDGSTLAYAIENGAGAHDGVTVWRGPIGQPTTDEVIAGTGRYTNLAIAHNGAALCFLSDTRTYASDVPRDDAYVVDLRAPHPVAQLVVAETTPGLKRGTAPNANGTLAFSHDGQRLFLGTAAAPTPQPSGTPVPLAVDLWTYKDLRLQSQQMHDAAQDRKRTYEAVYDLRTQRFAQLGSTTLATIERNENPTVALGFDERPYAIESSWEGDRSRDLYAVTLATGARRLLARKTTTVVLSPGGTYAVAWDQTRRHWISIRTRDGKRTVLAPDAKVTFYDETDDHPSPPPPYGLGGWLEGDRGVIVYDRYDPWLVDPASGHAVNLTHGAGRATGVVYSILQTDSERDTLPAGKPFLLGLSDQRTYASGFARIPYTGGVPRTLLRADKLVSNSFAGIFGGVHDRIGAPLVARHADVAAFTEESYREFRDLWSSDLSFAHPHKVTLANPQLANYRWGTESLISYKSTDGIPLRAVLLKPDGFDPHKKYPMLVYFYEKWSQQFHNFYVPAPSYPTISRYVSHGYVVLLPDVVYHIGHPGPSALHAILPAVDAVTKLGYIDEKHIGIAGHSWAAYQINYMITQTDRFRAAEAGAAVSNMTSAYGGIRLESGVVREGQYEAGQSRIGATPWDRPDLYLENSGLFHIRNIHTPYLTMHNDADGAVPFEQGVEFITAMRRLGKPAYMFVFNGKDHNLRNTPADHDDLAYWAVVFDEWFDYWLAGAPRPSWFDGIDYLHKGERDVRPLYGESESSGKR